MIVTQKSLLAKPPANKHGLTDITKLPAPDRQIVHIDLMTEPTRDGKQRYFATWGSPEMVRATAQCTGSCCVDWKTGQRKPEVERLHRSWRSQVFFGLVATGVERWKQNGFEVQVHDRTGGV